MKIYKNLIKRIIFYVLSICILYMIAKLDNKIIYAYEDIYPRGVCGWFACIGGNEPCARIKIGGTYITCFGPLL